jgi:uncharacterized protein
MFRAFLFLLLFPFCVMAQGYPAMPTNYVTDEAQVLQNDEENSLNAILKSFEDSTSIQVFVYTANSLNGEVMADMCQNIFHTWKIGNKKTNNGVLIGIFVNDHKFRIHTGYGMEGVLPDLLTKKIQDEFMRPHFKENDYYAGIEAGITQLKYYSKHEYKPEQKRSKFYIVLYVVYAVQFVLFLLVCYALYKNGRDALKTKEDKKEQKARRTAFIISFVLLFIPFVGVVGLIFLAVVSFSIGKKSVRRKGFNSSKDNNSSSWSSSSPSDDSSSSSSSDFSGGGGGDSGGGGSDSSW